MGPAVLRRSARGEGDPCASWLASLRARRRWRAETSIAVARIWMERQRSSGRRYGARMDDYKIGAEKATLVTNRPAIEGSPFQSADDTWLQPDPDYPAHALDPETKKPLCPTPIRSRCYRASRGRRQASGPARAAWRRSRSARSLSPRSRPARRRRSRLPIDGQSLPCHRPAPAPAGSSRRADPMCRRGDLSAGASTDQLGSVVSWRYVLRSIVSA